MNRKQRNLTQLAILVLLFLLVILTLVMQQSWPDKPVRRVEISVIMQEADSHIWSEARQGMDQAADHYGVELRVLVPGEKNTVTEQVTLLEQEIKNGTDCLVIVPEDDPDFERLAAEHPDIPIVTMESSLKAGEICISADNFRVGKMLAQAVQEDFSGGTALIMEEIRNSQGLRLRTESAKAALKDHGFQILEWSSKNKLDLEKADFVIAPDKEAAIRLMNYFDAGQFSLPIYTAGSGNEIVAGLENGDIAAAVVWSEYAVGYQAVEQAVCLAFGHVAPAPDVPVFLIRKEGIYETENQKILFPIGH